MTTLLVLTVGQSDVQLVVEGGRTEFKKDRCARLHAELERRDNDWGVVDAPDAKRPDDVEALPSGAFDLCTPKLDAVLDDLDGKGVGVTYALILETRRDPEAERGDPRAAGLVLARRLRERLGEGLDVQRTAILEGSERLEDRGEPRDAVVRREVVARLDEAVRDATAKIADGRVVVATTGGMPVIATLVEDVVRLYAGGATSVELLEVADGAKADPPTRDRAVARRSVPEPAQSYRARRHALDLIEGGNLLGAWGAARHLHGDEVELRWTRVVEWLSRFAASLHVPAECDVPLLQHPRMAVRAALRVEFALRAGDIPRAVHGTVAFFEAALWDGLNERVERSEDPERRRYFRIKNGEAPGGDKLLREGDGSDENRKRPFELKETIGGVSWYWIYDGDGGPAARLAKRFLKREGLVAFDKALGSGSSGIRALRHDVAHDEPTPKLMDAARAQMRTASLWSDRDTFLSQPLVQDVLRELGEESPDHLCGDLVSTVRSRLLDAPR